MISSRPKTLWLALVRGCAELVFYLPFAIALAHYLLPDSLILWWLLTLPLVYSVPAAILRANRRIRIIIRILLMLSIGVAHGFLTSILTGSAIHPVSIAVSGVLGAIFADRGFVQWRDGWKASFHSLHMAVGVISYILMQPIKLLALKELAAYSLIWNAGAIVSILLFFILTNERHLQSESVDSHNSPALKASRRLNRLWMGLLLGLIGFLMVFRQLREWIEETLLAFLKSLFSGANEEPPPIEQPEQMPAPQELPPMEPQSESWLMNVLELIIQVIAYMLLAAGAVALVYYLGKYVYRGILLLLHKLASKDKAKKEEEGDFTDEVENIVASKWQWRKRSRSGKQRAASWNDLTSNMERIRYLYQTWLLSERERGYEAKPYLSPRETAMEAGASAGGTLSNEQSSFIELYEEARYGEREPSGEEVLRHRDRLAAEQKRK